nr:MAG TPA: hypothetical protein [Caudoviricetes sp.]
MQQESTSLTRVMFYKNKKNKKHPCTATNNARAKLSPMV